MNNEEIAKQIEETEIKLKQLRDALSEPTRKPNISEVWEGKNTGSVYHFDNNGHTKLQGFMAGTRMVFDFDLDNYKYLGTFDEVFIRRDEVAVDYVPKRDIRALTDFNDDSLASCIKQGLNFEGCPILHKQLTDLID